MNDLKNKQAPKVGVYICHCGGNISDHVNVDDVERQAACLTPGVSVARQNSFMCSDPGQEMIIEDVKSGKVDRIVVASCAPSLHETTFRGALERAGLNPYLYEHANIREQVSWVHHGPGATGKAASLVTSAVAKAVDLNPLESIRVDALKHATVIGGGIAGLKAAGELVRQGIKVTLVEKSPFLGGNLVKLDRLYPNGDKASEIISQLYQPLAQSELAEVLTCAQLIGSEGYVGNFELKLRREKPSHEAALDSLKKAGGRLNRYMDGIGLMPCEPAQEDEVINLSTGAVVIATGFETYQPQKGEFGYGESPQVITLSELKQLSAQQPQSGGSLNINGRRINSLAMIHCVGNRHIPGMYEAPDGTCHEYCSRTCCTAALDTAVQLREQFKDTVIYDLHRDIRTYGRGQEDIYRKASENRVVFIRFEADALPQVHIASCRPDSNQVGVTVKDVTLNGEELALDVDLVVLVTGVVPAPTDTLVEQFKVSQGADGFLLEVHPKLRPVEPAVSGVYLAGSCQAPMDSSEAVSAASASAAKAAAILGRGYVELDPFIAQVDPDKCQGHGECAKVCIAEDALVMKEQPDCGQRPVINPALCLGCGVCVAVCPEEAINVAGWTLDQYREMVAALVNEPQQGEEAA